MYHTHFFFFFFQAEDGIRDVERSRGLGDVYKRQDYRGINVNAGGVEKPAGAEPNWGTPNEYGVPENMPP